MHAVEAASLRTPNKWAKFSGRWDVTDHAIEYRQDFEGDADAPSTGLIMCDLHMDDGVAEVAAMIDKPDRDACARIIFRRDANGRCFAAGLGGWGRAYTISVYDTGEWRLLASQGTYGLLEPQHVYHLRVSTDGPDIALRVEGVDILHADAGQSFDGNGLGLMAWRSRAIFSAFRATPPRPKAFVMMPFAEAMDPLYMNVIRPSILKASFECRRADNVTRPGNIIDDVHLDIARSAVVIAEVSIPNPNVYYELGYAAAKGKQTILLAKKGTQLPFDVHSRRCIQYTDDDAGQERLDSDLYRYLSDLGSRAS
jgi:hypothetical protein